MDAAIIASTGLLGLASVPHCAAMCGGPCATLVGRTRSAPWAFHLARIASYAAGGALAAASVGAAARFAQSAPWLLPLWALLQAAVLLAGAYMLATGRAPSLAGIATRGSPLPAGTQAIRWGTARASVAGSLWVAWQCGALQGALVVAALASGPAAGAAAMTLFALATGLGLWLAPWLWARMAGPLLKERATRAAGALLMLASGWALGHGLWAQVRVWCA